MTSLLTMKPWQAVAAPASLAVAASCVLVSTLSLGRAATGRLPEGAPPLQPRAPSPALAAAGTPAGSLLEAGGEALEVSVDSGLAPGLAHGSVAQASSFAVQPDGRVLVGGLFSHFQGVSRSNLARMNADGVVDATFDVAVMPMVNALALQPDGRFVTAAAKLSRFLPDGSRDPQSPEGDCCVSRLGLQPDGGLLAGGNFEIAVRQSRTRLRRFTAEGTLDPTFEVEFNQFQERSVESLAIQRDGRILVAGEFDLLAGQPRRNLGRLNLDGSLDDSFNAEADDTVRVIALQRDGGILIGGDFARVNGQPRTRLARLLPDGSLDADFRVDVAGARVLALALQADGKIVVGGEFNGLGRQPRSNLGRLLPDGLADPAFTIPANQRVQALTIQPDGNILLGGWFTRLGGEACTGIGRLLNNEAPGEDLSCANGTITWHRTGSSPEIWRATFEYSTDGEAWTLLGHAEATPEGWSFATVQDLAGGALRARGYVTGGEGNASTWFVETLLTLTPPPPQILVGEGSPRFTAEGFLFDITGSPGDVVVVEVSVDLREWGELEVINPLEAEPRSVTDPDAGRSGPRFYRVRRLP